MNTMEPKKVVAVLFGGKSPEHEVSIITGVQVVNNIDSTKYDVLPIYITKSGKWLTSSSFSRIEVFKDLASAETHGNIVDFVAEPSKPLRIRKFLTLGEPKYINVDVLFPCFHGSLGENGGFQGIFEISEVAYVGSGILGSAISMDKVVMKELFKSAGLSITKYDWFYRNDWNNDKDLIIKRLEDKLKYPMFVKPSNGGSSIGIAKAKNKEELINGIEIASLFDRKIVVEESYENAKEINISVIGNSGSKLETSVCEEVFASSDFLNYDDKYSAEGSKTEGTKSNINNSGMASVQRKIPADLKPENIKNIEDTAKKAFELLDCSGLVRIDFLVKEDNNEIKILEVNTIPGSMSFYLWEPSNLPFKNMVTKLIELAIERRNEAKHNTLVFQSNILQNMNGSLKGPKNSKI